MYTWNFIDKVIYINLDKRTDRRKHMEDTVLHVFPSEKVLRFPAIEHENGAIGCSLSHIAIMEMALNNKWKNVLILEDDVTWNKSLPSHSFIKNFKMNNNNVISSKQYNFLEQMAKKHYDVIHLGPSDCKYNPITYRLESGYCTSSYLVNSHYLPKLIENFKESVKLLKIDNNNLYTCDTYWQILMKEDVWYVCVPCLMYQREGYSDIEKKNKNNIEYWILE